MENVKDRPEDFVMEDIENLEEPEFRFALFGLGLWSLLVIMYVVLMKMEVISGL